MTYYRIPEMTERKDFARIFHTEWKLKSENISREKTSREIRLYRESGTQGTLPQGWRQDSSDRRAGWSFQQGSKNG